jgi:hypothetical protein
LVDEVERPSGGLAQMLDLETWEGPVETRRNFPAFRFAFVRLAPPYRGPN